MRADYALAHITDSMLSTYMKSQLQSIGPAPICSPKKTTGCKCDQIAKVILGSCKGHLAVGSNIQTQSFSTPLGSGNHASLRTASMWRGKLGVFPFALP